LVATAILSAAGAALSVWPVRRRAGVATPELKVLSEAAFWTLIAFAERVVPAGADHLQVARAVDHALTYISVESQHDLNTLLGLLENGVVGLLFGVSPRPFSHRSPEARDATILDWANSSLTLRRGGFQALRKLCLAAHFGEQTSWKGMGYQGPPATGGLFYDDSKAGAR
jgi:hypothetical protein